MRQIHIIVAQILSFLEVGGSAAHKLVDFDSSALFRGHRQGRGENWEQHQEDERAGQKLGFHAPIILQQAIAWKAAINGAAKARALI
jgi:hypothetical protein